MVEVIKHNQNSLLFSKVLFALFIRDLYKEIKKKKNQYPGHERAIFCTIDVRVWRSCLLRERKKKGFNPEKN